LFGELSGSNHGRRVPGQVKLKSEE
jgi:hypothetical protein